MTVLGTRHRATFPSLSQARTYRDKIKSDSRIDPEGTLERIKSVRKVIHEPGDVTLEEIKDAYMEKLDDYSHNHKRVIEYVYNKLLKSLPWRTVSDITVADWRQYCRKRRSVDGMKPRTINRDLITLKASLNHALKVGLINRNPMDEKFEKLPEPRPFQRFLTKPEVNQILDVCEQCEPRIYAPVRLAINTGLRLGEITHLRWIDVSPKAISVCIQDDWSPKWQHERKVPISSEIYNLLMIQSRRRKYVFTVVAKKGSSLPEYYMREDFLTKCFKKIIISAQIRDPEEIHFHTLRHSFISHLVMSGADVGSVKELAGHESLSTTQNYMHLAKDHLEDAARKINF